MNKKKFFKVYLWIMLIMFPIVMISDIADNEPSDFIDYLDYLSWATALLGVFGYCYEKKIASKIFWRAYLPTIIIWDIFVGYRDIKDDPEFLDPIFLGLFIFVCLIFIVPEYIGLYLYGYREKE